MHILSLTSTPPRFQFLPRFFAQLSRQRTMPDRIELNIPRVYRRFGGETPALPALPDLVSIVTVDEDLGPATKILPTAQRWREKNPAIVFCDDDQFYDRDWFARLAALSAERPEDAICEQGEFLAEGPAPVQRPLAVQRPPVNKNFAYRLKKIATLGLAPPPTQFSSSGYVSLLQGFGGVCLRPAHLPAETWTIPAEMFSHDDIWLSGMLTLNRVGIWLDAASPKPSVFRASSRREPLMGVNVDSRCITYMRRTYGLWT